MKFFKNLKLFIILGVEFVAIAIILALIFFAGKKQYTVTFDINGGTLISGDLEQSVIQGSNASAPSVVKEGHYLRGWSGSYTKVTKDVTVKAVWEYETTPGIEYITKNTYAVISGCFEGVTGDVYIGAYYNDYKVLSIKASAFENCSRITNLYLLDGILTIESRAFASCSSLVSIELPDTAIFIGEEAFAGCSSLKEITLPSNLESIGAFAFSGCTSLETVYIPSGIKEISESAFEGCTNLKNVIFLEDEAGDNGSAELPESNSENSEESEFVPALVIGDRAFAGCSSLENINFTDNLAIIGNGAFENCALLEEITLPEHLVLIGDGAFRGCKAISEIKIPESVKTIGSLAFDSYATTVYIPYDEDEELPLGWQENWCSSEVTVVRSQPSNDASNADGSESDSEAENADK